MYQEEEGGVHYLFLKLCSNYHLRQLFLVSGLLLDVTAVRQREKSSLVFSPFRATLVMYCNIMHQAKI